MMALCNSISHQEFGQAWAGGAEGPWRSGEPGRSLGGMFTALWAARPLHWKVLQCPGEVNSRLTQDSAPWLLWMCGDREGAQESTKTVKQSALGKTAKCTTVLASVLSPFKTSQFTNICLLFPQDASPMPCGLLAMKWLVNT